MVTNKHTVSLDTPQYAVDPEHRIPVVDYPGKMTPIPPSRMFTIKTALKTYQQKAGEEAVVYDASQGDGGASLPGVPRDILMQAAELQIEHGTGYDKPYGTELFRQVTYEDYWGIEPASGWTTENIIFCQGGRDALQKAYQAMVSLGTGRVGDLLLVSRVPWISYNWGPYGVGLNVLRAPGHPEESWRYTPDSIRESVAFAEREGRKIAGIVITSPDNPTGRTMSVDEQIVLARTAIEAGIPYVLIDWFYHYITEGAPNDINQVLQAFSSEDRKKLIFLDGLSKSMGASNIRSAHLLADTKVVKFINSQASHAVIPSFYAQAVAIVAFLMGFREAAKGIIEPCAASRRALRAELEKDGFSYVMGDGYYAFINVGQFVDAGGWEDTIALGQYLAEDYGVAVVPGSFFSDAGDRWVRFSYALPAEKTVAAYQQMMTGLRALG